MKRKQAEKFIEELNLLLEKYNFGMLHYETLNFVDLSDRKNFKDGYIEARYDGKGEGIEVIEYACMEEEQGEEEKNEK